MGRWLGNLGGVSICRKLCRTVSTYVVENGEGHSRCIRVARFKVKSTILKCDSRQFSIGAKLGRVARVGEVQC